MSDKISVVTVCFNSELEIEKTINSVLKQDYDGMEYIIKDGGSIDDTNKIIKKYQSEFQDRNVFFKHIVSHDNGIYDAMNEAVKYCNGDWVIFMNSGDLFYNETVLSDVFRNKDWNNVDVIYGHTLLRLSEKRGYITNHDADFLEEEMSLCHQSLFVRKELLQKFPFDCQYRIKADYDQMLRIKKSGYVFYKVNMIISDRDRAGISNRCTGICFREDNLINDKYDLNLKKKSFFLGYLKQIIKFCFPKLLTFYGVQKREKNILKYK